MNQMQVRSKYLHVLIGLINEREGGQGGVEGGEKINRKLFKYTQNRSAA